MVILSMMMVNPFMRSFILFLLMGWFELCAASAFFDNEKFAALWGGLAVLQTDDDFFNGDGQCANKVAHEITP